MTGTAQSGNIPSLCETQHAFLNDQLTRANDSRLHHDQLIWVLFSIAFGANALLIGALSQVSSNTPFENQMNFFIPFFGLALSLGWALSQIDIIYYNLLNENLVIRIEETLIKGRLPYEDVIPLKLIQKPSKWKGLLCLAPVFCIIFWSGLLWSYHSLVATIIGANILFYIGFISLAIFLIYVYKQYF
jgi:hypothetical protein